MKLPKIGATHIVNTDEIILDLLITAECEAFQGHFPDHPILPGVVQIDWALRLAVLHFNLGTQTTRDFQVKFRNVIQPGNPLSLLLQFDRIKQRLLFTYKSNLAVMSQGSIRLDTSS